MAWVGWVAFVISQVVVLVVGAWGLLALTDTDIRKPSRDAVRTAVFLSGICAVLLVVVDGLIAIGVIGPGWPLSVRTSMELMAAAVLLGLMVFTVIGIVDGKGWSTFGGFFGLLGVALFGLLLVTNSFNGHHGGANAPAESADSAPTSQSSSERPVPSTPSVSSSPSAIVTVFVTGTEGAPQPTASASAGDSPATWVAAGGALLGGLGAFLAVVRRRRDG